MSAHHEDVCQVCGTKDNECRFSPMMRLNVAPRQHDEGRQANRDGDYGSEKKHPFHARDSVVTGDKTFEESEIASERELCCHAEEVAEDVSAL